MEVRSVGKAIGDMFFLEVLIINDGGYFAGIVGDELLLTTRGVVSSI